MKTNTEIRLQGMRALIASLGLVDAERFMVAAREPGFDYTAWRREHLAAGESLEALAEAANTYSAQSAEMTRVVAPKP